ncbi:MAG: hemolysin III family protein [Nocardioides sp.]
MDEVVPSARDSLPSSLADAVAEIKPRLRGWLHLASAPLTLAAGIVLIALSPNASTRIGSAVYAASALLLFTVSAVYHRGHWSPRTHGVLRRFDHANIFLLIAGTYTPFTVVFLQGSQRVVLLTVVWSVAVLGVLFKVFWIGAPKWLYMPIYVGMGWTGVFYIPSFAEGSERLGVGIGTAVLVLVAIGGALYTVGGLVYSVRRPDPWPRWFGFHEIFHSFTILAFVSHYVGISMAVYSLR